jgi:hypothetical protein
MAPDGKFAVALLPHATRNDRLRSSVRMFNTPELVGHFVIECLMHQGEARDRCGPGQGAFLMHLVDRPLNDDMGAGFQRKGPRLGLKFGPGEGVFNVARACVVPLDQVRVVAVHHPDEVRQLCRAVWVKPVSQHRRLALDIDRQVRQPGRHVLFEEAWFDPAWCL